ncbi:MAG: hypothetical protein OHK0017_06160 [Patescibacteria group bacterium]
MFVLISPHYRSNSELDRFVVSAELPQFILDQGLVPLVCCYETNSVSKEKQIINAERYFDSNIGGLILTGGPDVQVNSNNKTEHNLLRDYFELHLIKLALQAQVPILGICRGMQLLNVYFGGTLKNINSDADSSIVHSKSKTNKSQDLEDYDLSDIHDLITIPEGYLSKLYGEKDRIQVNSIHNQAIDKLGKGLEIDAVAQDGIIEAVSNPELKIFGVQFHPEVDLSKTNYRRLIQMWLKLVPDFHKI